MCIIICWLNILPLKDSPCFILFSQIIFQEPDYRHRLLLDSDCAVLSCSSCMRTALQVSSSSDWCWAELKGYGTYFDVLTLQLHTTICDMVTLLNQDLFLQTSYNNYFYPILYLKNWSFLTKWPNQHLPQFYPSIFFEAFFFFKLLW